MNKQEKLILAKTCANKISVLAHKQDKLFEKLKVDLNISADDEYLVDVLFDYCFNGGEYSLKLLNKYLEKQTNTCI